MCWYEITAQTAKLIWWFDLYRNVCSSRLKEVNEGINYDSHHNLKLPNPLFYDILLDYNWSRDKDCIEVDGQHYENGAENELYR